jgi:hypothetical protein
MSFIKKLEALVVRLGQVDQLSITLVKNELSKHFTRSGISNTSEIKKQLQEQYQHWVDTNSEPYLKEALEGNLKILDELLQLIDEDSIIKQKQQELTKLLEEKQLSDQYIRKLNVQRSQEQERESESLQNMVGVYTQVKDYHLEKRNSEYAIHTDTNLNGKTYRVKELKEIIDTELATINDKLERIAIAEQYDIKESLKSTLTHKHNIVINGDAEKFILALQFQQSTCGDYLKLIKKLHNEIVQIFAENGNVSQFLANEISQFIEAKSQTLQQYQIQFDDSANQIVKYPISSDIKSAIIKELEDAEFSTNNYLKAIQVVKLSYQKKYDTLMQPTLITSFLNKVNLTQTNTQELPDIKKTIEYLTLCEKKQSLHLQLKEETRTLNRYKRLIDTESTNNETTSLESIVEIVKKSLEQLPQSDQWNELRHKIQNLPEEFDEKCRALFHLIPMLKYALDKLMEQRKETIELLNQYHNASLTISQFIQKRKVSLEGFKKLLDNIELLKPDKQKFEKEHRELSQWSALVNSYMENHRTYEQVRKDLRAIDKNIRKEIRQNKEVKEKHRDFLRENPDLTIQSGKIEHSISKLCSQLQTVIPPEPIKIPPAPIEEDKTILHPNSETPILQVFAIPEVNFVLKKQLSYSNESELKCVNSLYDKCHEKTKNADKQLWLYNLKEICSAWIKQHNIDDERVRYNQMVNLFYDLRIHKDSSLIDAYIKLVPQNQMNEGFDSLLPLLALKPSISILEALSTTITDPLKSCGEGSLREEINQGLTLLQEHDKRLRHAKADKYKEFHQIKKLYEFAVSQSLKDKKNYVASLANIEQDPKYTNLKQHRSFWGNFCQGLAKVISAIKSLFCIKDSYQNQFCFFRTKSIKNLNASFDQCSLVESLMPSTDVDEALLPLN